MQPPRTPVGPQTQELRFATAMTGGVSLAIWIGGVARELDLLQRASERRRATTAPPVVESGLPDANLETLYLRLLDLLDMTVEVDILAGTSAGGINAALLGMARVNGIDLAPARDLWLRLGGLERLLRDPGEEDPPSLLQGDGVLLSGLNEAMAKLWEGRRPPAGSRPTTVRLTTTLIDGETSRFTDAYGTLVQDVDHRGCFTFDEQQLSDPGICPALATAARGSASFPLAFEPGFVGLEDDAGRPGMKAYANITRAHWVADGGLLANRPIGPLLRDIFERPAERQVRRVLLYVIPFPGAQPDPRATPAPSRLDEPMSTADALVGDLGAVVEQSISGDLRAFREHNDRVDSQCDTRLRIAQLGLRLVPRPDGGWGDQRVSDELRVVDGPMLEDYRARESEWLARHLVAALLRDIGARPEPALPAHWRASLAPGHAIEERCRAAAAERIAAGWTLRPGSTVECRDLARFGLSAFEGARGTVITMLRSAFALARQPSQREAIGGALARVHGALVAGPRPDLGGLVGAELGEMLVRGEESGDLPVIAADLARIYWARITPAEQVLTTAWTELGSVVHELRATLAALAGTEPGRTRAAAGEPLSRIRRDRLSHQRAAAELGTYVAFLAGGSREISVGLFDLHVATRSVLPVGAQLEQPVELVQISADSRTLLSPRATAGEKLTGLQLHHFGAFYKSSWRASDWTWGRIDGAGWLVHLLLDPRRIDVITVGERDRAQSFYWRLRNVLGLPDGGADGDDGEAAREGAVLEELSFLDTPGMPLPKSLPETSLWVARELQRWIACTELPVIANEIVANQSKRIDPWAAHVLAHPAPVDPDARMRARMGALLATCTVPDERLEDEAGEPLFMRTVTKAVAVAAALANSAARPIGLFRPVLATLRTITMGGHRVARASHGGTAAMFAAGLGALFVGAVLAISGGSLLALSGAGLAAAGLYAVAVAAWGFSGRALRASAAGFGLIAVLTLGAARQVLFGTAKCAQDACSPDDIGWFGRHALPWLADSFWNVTFAIVALFGLAVVVGIATTRRSRPRRRTTAVDLARDTAAILASRGDDAARSPARVEPEAPEMLPAEPVATGTGRSSG